MPNWTDANKIYQSNTNQSTQNKCVNNFKIYLYFVSLICPYKINMLTILKYISILLA